MLSLQAFGNVPQLINLVCILCIDVDVDILALERVATPAWWVLSLCQGNERNSAPTHADSPHFHLSGSTLALLATLFSNYSHGGYHLKVIRLPLDCNLKCSTSPSTPPALQPCLRGRLLRPLSTWMHFCNLSLQKE